MCVFYDFASGRLSQRSSPFAFSRLLTLVARVDRFKASAFASPDAAIAAGFHLSFHVSRFAAPLVDFVL